MEPTAVFFTPARRSSAIPIPPRAPKVTRMVDYSQPEDNVPPRDLHYARPLTAIGHEYLHQQLQRSLTTEQDRRSSMLDADMPDCAESIENVPPMSSSMHNVRSIAIPAQSPRKVAPIPPPPASRQYNNEPAIESDDDDDDVDEDVSM